MITGIIAISEYTIAIEYDVNNNAIYVGEAKPGAGQGQTGWRIKLLTYDVNNNCTDVQWATSNTHFDKIWDNRAAYAYA